MARGFLVIRLLRWLEIWDPWYGSGLAAIEVGNLVSRCGGDSSLANEHSTSITYHGHQVSNLSTLSE